MSDIVDDHGTPVNGGMPKFVQERMKQRKVSIQLCDISDKF